MAFTKITAAGIGSTETVTLDGVSVINNESIGGNLTVTGNATIGGVLTYEDVTNVDSVGVITARAGVLVGSGITLSKDGDVFFTGIATGNGSGLTNLTAGNLTGALPAISGANLTGIAATDNVRTGILDVAGVGTFRGDVNIPDKIIHLGDTNTAIRFPADDTVTVETGGSERVRIDSSGRMGIGDDSPDRELVVKHASSNSTIKIESANTHTSQLMFADSDGEQIGRVAVYHGSGQVTSNSLTLDTAGTARIRVEPAGNINVSQNLNVAGVVTATSFSGISTASTSDFAQISRYTVPSEVSEVDIDFDNTNYTHFKLFISSQNNAYDANVYCRFKYGGSYSSASAYYSGNIKKHSSGFDSSVYGGQNQNYGYLIDNVGGNNATYERWQLIADINAGTSDGMGFMRYDSYHKDNSGNYANTMGVIGFGNFGVLQGVRFYASSGNLESGAVYTLYGYK